MAISGATALPIPTVSTKITMEPLVTRRSANYHPSIWGDHFLAYSSHPTVNWDFIATIHLSRMCLDEEFNRLSFLFLFFYLFFSLNSLSKTTYFI